MIPFIPDSELESRALEVLLEYERRELSLIQPPVPIDLIIEHVLRMDIVWDSIDVRETDVRVLAAIELGSSSRRIVMNERELNFFERFVGTEAYSKAHEVGHAILHLPSDPTLQTDLWTGSGAITLCRSNFSDRRELQAERFAAYLLMPKNLVHLAVGRDPITSWHQVYDLRDRFDVSVTAMRKRLEELNLLYVDEAGNIYPSREAASGQARLPL